VAGVVRNQRQAVRHRYAANQHVELALQATNSFQVGFLLGVGFQRGRDAQPTGGRKQPQEFIQVLAVADLAVILLLAAHLLQGKLLRPWVRLVTSELHQPPGRQEIIV